MTIPYFTMPLAPQLDYGDQYKMPRKEVASKVATPMEEAKREIEDAVRGVQEAQDAVGKGVWEE